MTEEEMQKFMQQSLAGLKDVFDQLANEEMAQKNSMTADSISDNGGVSSSGSVSATSPVENMGVSEPAPEPVKPAPEPVKPVPVQPTPAPVSVRPAPMPASAQPHPSGLIGSPKPKFDFQPAPAKVEEQSIDMSDVSLDEDVDLFGRDASSEFARRSKIVMSTGGDEHHCNTYDFPPVKSEVETMPDVQNENVGNDSVTSSDDDMDKFFARMDDMTQDLFSKLNLTQAVSECKEDFTQFDGSKNTMKFGDNKVEYTEKKEKLGFDLSLNKHDNPERTARNFVELSNKFTAKAIQAFGGYNHITDLAIKSDVVIINCCAYKPTVDPASIEYLPYDLRNGVSNGAYAWLFDYSTLRKMKNLVNLSFDESSFVYGKVRPDLGIRLGFTPESLFKVCKSLQLLQIESTMINSLHPDESNDMFKRQSRAEQMYNKCIELGMGATKTCWNSVVDVFKDPSRSFLSKAWGVAWRGAATAVTGTATLAGKTGGVVAKAGKGIANFISAVKDNK